MTAERYAKLFASLGRASSIAGSYDGRDAACLVALHAHKSASSVLAYRAAYPQRRIILVLTGTDIYRDIHRSARAMRAMEAADALVTLQPHALSELPRHLRKKARAIIQSVPRMRHRTRTPAGSRFIVCVLGHLRAEKDPMRAAYAVRMVDPKLRVTMLHAGAILQPHLQRAVQREQSMNPRYRYLGEMSRESALALLARSDVLVQSSRMEGGANSICEALACGTPIIASRIGGNTGILGSRYPGLYRTGDTQALARLIQKAATSDIFYERLRVACAERAPLVEPKRERAAWREVLG